MRVWLGWLGVLRSCPRLGEIPVRLDGALRQLLEERGRFG